VKINSISGWIGIGVCLKELVISNKLKFVVNKMNFIHGTFMISTNGYSWNSNNEDENNCQLGKSFPKIKPGCEFTMRFEAEEETLHFKISQPECPVFEYTLTDVAYPRGNFLVPCVLFLNPGDEVVFKNLIKYKPIPL
jgi:hypothetical protein